MWNDTGDSGQWERNYLERSRRGLSARVAKERGQKLAPRISSVNAVFRRGGFTVGTSPYTIP